MRKRSFNEDSKGLLLSTMSFTCQANKQWFDTVGTEFPGFLPLPLLPSGLCSCHFGWLCWWYSLSRCPGLFKKVTSAGIYCAVHASSNLPYTRCAGLNMVFKNGYVQKKFFAVKLCMPFAKLKVQWVQRFNSPPTQFPGCPKLLPVGLGLSGHFVLCQYLLSMPKWHLQNEMRPFIPLSSKNAWQSMPKKAKTYQNKM